MSKKPQQEQPDLAAEARQEQGTRTGEQESLRAHSTRLATDVESLAASIETTLGELGDVRGRFAVGPDPEAQQIAEEAARLEAVSANLAEQTTRLQEEIAAVVAETEQAKQERQVPPRLIERIKVLDGSYPHLVFKRGDHHDDASVECPRGRITDVRGKGGERPVIVPTDAGVIVEPDREVGTDGMWGCTTIIIRHPKGKLFAHLTPTNKLAYMDWDMKKDESNESTAEDIISTLQAAGLDLNECQGSIIGNIGTSDGKYERNRLLKIWNHLGERLKGAGLTHWKTIEVPLDETLVFDTPDKLGKALVMGHPAQVNATGSFEVDKRDVDARWVEV